MSETIANGDVQDGAQSLARVERFSAEDLRSIDFNSAVQLAQDTYGVAVAVVSDVLGDGFALVKTEDKGRLEGVPLLVLAYNFSEGEQGEFVTMRIVTKNDDKLIVNDGSTGLCQQMRDWDKQNGGNPRALFVPNGFRRSDYEYTDPATGRKRPATTFYLDTSAAAK